MTIQRILDSRPDATPICIAPDADIGDALDLLAAKNIGALIVSYDGVSVDGIVSERDIVRRLQAEGPDIYRNRVSDLMTEKVITCVAEDRAASIMAVMVSRHVRHVPVVKDDKIVGMVSIRDLLQLRLNEVQSEADAMRTYISGQAT